MFLVLGSVLFTVLGSVFTGARASAPVPDLVVFVPAGAARQPIARFDGERWTATCTTSPGTTAAQLQQVRRVAASSAEWSGLQRVIGEVFSRRERDERVAVARIASVPVSIDTVYASGPPTTATYYFEASKRVVDTSPNADPDTDPAGVLTVRVTGWLQASSSGPRSIASKADVEWQQLDRAPTSQVDLTPIGTLRQADALVWVMKRGGDSTPSFSLYEMRASTVQLLLRSQC